MSDIDNLKRKLAASESRWEAIQMTGANAQRELDYAVAVFEKHKEEMSTEDLQSTMAQIEEQKARIKDYVMKGYTVFSQDTVRINAAIKRLENKNADV